MTALARPEPDPAPSATLADPAARAVAAGIDRELSEAARARVAGGMADNTSRAYARDWETFTTWCATTGRTPLPASAETLAEYVTHLAITPTRRGTLPAPSTIERALACVQSRQQEGRAPPNAEGGRLALRAYRKERAKSC
ncbi:hypothetical protein [Streptosporangium sp. NPDC048865]|uniref:hypothetical protein n=1 Tax=Streptosporangium sp. NPDC048865 TaxID=3155766 RepID=UPI003438E30D